MVDDRSTVLTDGDKRGSGCQEGKHARIDQLQDPSDASVARIQSR